MNGNDVSETTETATTPARRACLVDGCTCKDARILSSRRASYFASVARARGETADRVVATETGWRLPTSPALDAVRTLAIRSTTDGDVEMDTAA